MRVSDDLASGPLATTGLPNVNAMGDLVWSLSSGFLPNANDGLLSPCLLLEPKAKLAWFFQRALFWLHFVSFSFVIKTEQ